MEILEVAASELPLCETAEEKWGSLKKRYISLLTLYPANRSEETRIGLKCTRMNWFYQCQTNCCTEVQECLRWNFESTEESKECCPTNLKTLCRWLLAVTVQENSIRMWHWKHQRQVWRNPDDRSGCKKSAPLKTASEEVGTDLKQQMGKHYLELYSRESDGSDTALHSIESLFVCEERMIFQLVKT